MKTNFRRILKEDIKKIVDEDYLGPAPELGDPHYIDVDHDEDEMDSPANYDAIVGNPIADPDDYVDYINEQCGCSAKPSTDYSLSSMATPGEALGIGVAIGKHKKSGAYMSKSQLYKIQKYAEELYDMIPDNHNLEDWMRSKLSEIADDIGEVYHALDHRIFKGKI